MTLSAGDKLGEYEILALIGEGGMGKVYKACQTSLNRVVALKVLPGYFSQDKEFITRFKNESIAAATLNHPNIVQIYAAGVSGDVHYFAMEYVEGESLFHRMARKQRVDPVQAVAIAIYVTQALDHAWRRAKIVHRDIKPDNIFLSEHGEVKLGDLGLAKCIDQSTMMTRTGTSLGTPQYTSPEQARGDAEIDFRADFYSLGCTLFHVLTGKPVYQASNVMGVILKHLNDPVPDLHAAWPGCPAPLVPLVRKMLAKDPAGRHASHEELLAELHSVHEQLQQPDVPVAAPSRTSSSASLPRVEKKSSVGLLTVLCVIALLLAVGALAWSPWKKNTPALASNGNATPPQPVASSTPAPTAPSETVLALTPVTAPAVTPTAPTPTPSPTPAIVAKATPTPTPAVLVAKSPTPAPAGFQPLTMVQQSSPRATPAVNMVVRATPFVPMNAAVHSPINLLRILDPAKDTIEGKWEVKEGQLFGEVRAEPPAARLVLPYIPPEEYDFHVSFTRRSGNQSIVQHLSHAGREVMWQMGGFKNTAWGFDSVAGTAGNANKSTVHSGITNGRRYDVVIRVRRDRLQVMVDGNMATDFATDWSNLTIHPMWQQPDPAQLAVGCQSSATFHVIEVVEVTGKGKLVR